MESTTELIQLLIESHTLETKIDVLTRLRLISDEKINGLVIANAKELFTELRKLLSGSGSLELSTAILLLISSISSKTKDQDVILQLPSLYSDLISVFNSTATSLIVLSKECLCSAIQKTMKPEQFLSTINRDGICSENPLVRRNAVDCLIEITKKCPFVMDDSKFGGIILKILEGMLGNSKELHEEIIKFIQTHPSVNRVSKKLSPELKAIYDELLHVKNVMFNENTAEDYKEIDDAITAEITKKFEPKQTANFPALSSLLPDMHPKPKTGALNSIIPDRILKDLDPNANWKQRACAIEELEEIIADDKSCANLEPVMPLFLQYLVGLLNDPNYKVAVTTLQIINKLLVTFTGVHTPDSVEPLIPGLVEKLGDNKVMIRQLAIMGLRLLSRIIEPIPILSKLLTFINSPKWHTREEILNFIIITFLENAHVKEFIQNVPCQEILAVIMLLLNDDKPKVIQIVFEACATIARLIDAEKICEIIHALVPDSEIFARIKYRIEADSIPILNPDGTLEFPHIANELQTQNSFYTGGNAKSQYSNLSQVAQNIGQKPGVFQSRYTSAGPVKRIEDRSAFEVHTAAKRPQTNFPLSAESPAKQNKGNMSPTFGNFALAQEIKDINLDREATPSPIKDLSNSPQQTKSPEWLSDWKQPEEKRPSITKPIIKSGAQTKPISKESDRTDSTRAGSTESSNRQFGQFGDRLRLLKSGNPKARQLSKVNDSQPQFSNLEETKNAGPKRIESGTNLDNNLQKRCSSLSAKPKLRSNPLSTENGNNESVTYLTPDQLTPVENPENMWKKCTEEIKNNANWVKQFESCNIARRICAHHPEILVSSPIMLHGFILDLLKHIESLRSTLAKNALLVFADLFSSAKKSLDADLDNIVPILLKKGTESGSFLGPHVIDALRKMCENSSETKVVTTLIGSLGAFTKVTPQAKLRAVHCLNTVIKRLGERMISSKDGEKIIYALAGVLSEGAIEIRNAAKEGFALASDEIANSVEFEKLLHRSLSSGLYKKVMESLSKTSNRSATSEEPTNTSLTGSSGSACKQSPAQCNFLVGNTKK